MKKTIQQEIYLCDFCGDEYYSPNCTGGCGKVICSDCRDKHSVEYACGVYHQGSRDGIYCLECFTKISTGKGTPEQQERLFAYQLVKRLSDEYKGWAQDFEARRKQAEANLERLSK